MIRVREYLDARGRNEYRTWFDGLDVAAATKVTVALERIAAGNTSSIKPVGEGVSEYKIDFGPGYRIYFGKDGERLVILYWWRHKETTESRYRRCQSSLARVQAAQEGQAEADRGKDRGKKQESETQVGELTMPLTRDFRDTIRERAQREPAFRQSLLREGLQLINSGDFATGRAVLRNYINATIGFSELARETKIPSPSLQRMFGPSGNPSAQNLFGVIAALQRSEGVSIELRMHIA